MTRGLDDTIQEIRWRPHHAAGGAACEAGTGLAPPPVRPRFRNPTSGSRGSRGDVRGNLLGQPAPGLLTLHRGSDQRWSLHDCQVAQELPPKMLVTVMVVVAVAVRRSRVCTVTRTGQVPGSRQRRRPLCYPTLAAPSEWDHDRPWRHAKWSKRARLSDASGLRPS